MNGFLVDTNTISEFVKPVPSADVLIWFRSVDPDLLFSSVITVGEIRLGIEKMPISKRRADLEVWLQAGLPAWFAANLLPVTRLIADRWGRVTVEARRKDMTLTTSDGLIAATALQHRLTLVTRNVKDFSGLGIDIVDPLAM